MLAVAGTGHERSFRWRECLPESRRSRQARKTDNAWAQRRNMAGKRTTLPAQTSLAHPVVKKHIPRVRSIVGSILSVLGGPSMKAILAIALCVLAGTANAADTTRYIALVNGGKDKAGHLWATRDGDGTTKVDYIIKDNGRGPELKEDFTVGKDGTLISYHVTGQTEIGAPVDETFTRDGDKASWKSTTDKGEQTVYGTALYTPLAGTPESLTVKFSALTKRSDGKLPLIPSGTLTWRKLVDSEVTNGSEKRKVQLVALTGIGFTPTIAWATTDASPRLFAFIFPGYLQLIEEGWEKNGTTLETQQKAAAKELLVAMNQRLTHPLVGTTLIKNARVFDSERATLGTGSDLLLQDGRIIAISSAGEEKRKADHLIDAGGRVLLPGLFDMHAHTDFWEGGLHLAAGITTIRDMGNNNDTLQQLIAQEEAGDLLSPRVVPAGFIEGESPNAARSGFVIKDLAEAKRAVDWYHEHGYPQIKIYNSFPKAILPETTAYAHSKGMRVSGHIPVHLRAHEAVEQGYDEIQHINQVLLNFLVDDKTDTRTPERFYLPAEKVAGLDFDSKPVQDFIAELVQHKTVIDPTLTTFDFIRQRDGVMSQAYAAVADHMPPDVKRGFLQGIMKIPDDATAARYEISYAKMIEFAGRMYKAGIPLVAGTDALAGFTLQRELELYVQAGMTPAQVLQIATYNGAKYARVLDDRGVIMQGKRADLILVDGDPTKVITDIRKVALVVKGDKAYYPSEIDEALGIKAFSPALVVK
jgi:cytosine/adenosine deaminase-related metal-dependent hydrolase